MEVITVGREPQHSLFSTHAPKIYWLKPVLTALIIHALLIYMLIAFWYQDTTQRTSTLMIKPSTTAIKSYLMTSTQYQSMIHTNLPPKLNEQRDIEYVNRNPSIIDVSQSTSITKDTQASLDEDAVIDEVVPSNNKRNTIQSISSAKIPIALPSQIKPETTTNLNKSVPSLTSIQQASSQYIQRDNINELELLISSQTALPKKNVGTMSEMDPQLDFIELTPKVDTSQPNTLNHRLDPNRIVKQGDYCYRVVDLATQVNPHGWGLGFAEYCGEDESKKQLTEAINNRISKVK